MSSQIIPAAPEGYNTVNPFIITREARQVIEFVKAVFGGEELPDALTIDNDGLILHAKVRIGNSIVQIADRKSDWPYTPSLLQVYVQDVAAALGKAEALGAKVITVPTEFLGAKFSRVQDAWGNLWWVYEYVGEVDWGAYAAEETNNEKSWGESSDWKPTPEAVYIHETLLEAMRNLGK